MGNFFRGKRLSLGAQFEHQIRTRVEKITYEKTLALMQEFAHRIVNYFKENRQFCNITGNAYTSFYSAVYYKGKLKYMVRAAKGEKTPTRVTLAEGEKYNLPYFYDGHKNDGYKGKKGGGHQWGPNLVYGRIGKDKPSGKDWAIVAVCPVEYAIFDEDNRIFETVYDTYEAFPDLFDASIMYADMSDIKTM